MTVAFYLNIISPHQLPLARAVAELVGQENFVYIYAEDFHVERAKMGWNDKVGGLRVEKMNGENAELLESADILYTGIRCLDLMARRSAAGKKTVYYSERWFKPQMGILRLLSPGYLRMARRFVGLLRNGHDLTYCPVGIHAAKDMARLCGLMHGDLRCLFRAPELDFERRPGGGMVVSRQSLVASEDKHCLGRMRIWGYFVEPSVNAMRPGKEAGDALASNLITNDKRPITSTLKVLWVGRILALKRVNTIIRAVGEVSTHYACSTWPSVTLDIYGIGPEEARLKKLAAKCSDIIRFHPSVPIAEVRRLMREHDVYVFSSNGMDGWGAVVNEALEEGMYVIGTGETGASASLLPEESLYSCGDWKRLASLLSHCSEAKRRGTLKGQGIGEWTAKNAAKRLLDIVR